MSAIWYLSCNALRYNILFSSHFCCSFFFCFFFIIEHCSISIFRHFYDGALLLLFLCLETKKKRFVILLRNFLYLRWRTIIMIIVVWFNANWMKHYHKNKYVWINVGKDCISHGCTLNSWQVVEVMFLSFGWFSFCLTRFLFGFLSFKKYFLFNKRRWFKKLWKLHKKVRKIIV